LTLHLRKLVVVGVGLIGGSLALALRRNAAVQQVVGVGRTRPNLADALQAGVVDRAHTLDERWTDELGDADVVLVATPVAQFAQLFEAMAPGLGPRTVVTDAGSTKQDVVAAAREHLGDAFRRFVPAHPIAGTEHSGARAAFASLFDGRTTILTPTQDTAAASTDTVRALWQACGASVLELDPRQHDALLAAVSHFPHLLAASCVAELAARPAARELFALAGTGFRDFTRIAAGSPEMWRDIALSNRDALLDELGSFRAALGTLEAALRERDGAALHAWLGAASEARRAWGKSRGET
jgi:prephenate dehydrogenase